MYLILKITEHNCTLGDIEKIRKAIEKEFTAELIPNKMHPQFIKITKLEIPDPRSI